MARLLLTDSQQSIFLVNPKFKIMSKIADQEIFSVATLLKMLLAFNTIWLVRALVCALILVPRMEQAGLTVIFNYRLVLLESFIELALITSIIGLSYRRKDC